MKEQIKAPEKIQLSDEEIATLSDTEFKTLVIRMLTERVEYSCKIQEKVKAMQSEIKENVQGTNSKGKDLHPRLHCPAKLSFRMEEQIKCFPDKVKLKEFIVTKPLLYELLKGLNLRKRR